MRYTLIGIVYKTICYLSLQESIVEQYSMLDLPIYLRTMNVTLHHSYNMNSTIQPFRLDPSTLCPDIRHIHLFCLSILIEIEMIKEKKIINKLCDYFEYLLNIRSTNNY